MEGNSVFHPLHLVIFIIERNVAFVKEIGTKNDVVMKIRGINNKGRVIINNHVLVEFREHDFLEGHECHGCSCTRKQKDP